MFLFTNFFGFKRFLKMSKIYFTKAEDSESELTEDLIGMRQALPVKPIGDDFDPSVPPSSGEEYLQHVVFEARKFAPVFTAQRVHPDTLNAKCDTNVLGLKPNLSSSILAPTEAWETEQVDLFTRLRNKVLDLRLQPTNSSNPKIKVPFVDAPVTTWQKFLNGHEPLLSVVFAFRQEQLQRALSVLFHMHCEGKFNIEQGAWVYAIAACLDHPLSREACGDLRDIARRCAYNRSIKTDENDKDVTMMNLIITIVVRYFKQIDLCDAT